MRWYRHGDPLWEPPVYVDRGCSYPDCKGTHKSKGLCLKHYQQQQLADPNSSQSKEYRNTRHRKKREGLTAVCRNPACSKTFVRPYKLGHPTGYCSEDCRKEAACIRARLWGILNQERIAQRKEFTKDERNARAREIWAEDAEFRKRAVRNALRRAERKGWTRPRLESHRRAIKALRSALARGSRVGELVTYEELYERDKGICQVKGCLDPDPIPFEEVTMDHVIPCIKGGPHTLDNLVIAHHSCNVRKKHH